MKILESFLIPVLLALIPLIIRSIYQYAKLIDKLAAIEKDLQQEIDARVSISRAHTEKAEYLWGEIIRLRQDLTRTETALNNHSGIEGHPTAMKEMRELEERFGRLKILCLQMNDQFSRSLHIAPIDPAKTTLS